MSEQEKSLVTEGVMPITWVPAKRHQKDTAVCGAKEHGKSYYGYKISAHAHKGYKLMRKIKVSVSSDTTLVTS